MLLMVLDMTRRIPGSCASVSHKNSSQTSKASNAVYAGYAEYSSCSSPIADYTSGDPEESAQHVVDSETHDTYGHI